MRRNKVPRASDRQKVATKQPNYPATRTNQTDIPTYSLQDAEKLAHALWDNFAGRDASPPDLALALNVSPTSSNWRVLTGSAIAYGLTSGGWNAQSISLTPLGRQIAAPVEEGGQEAARREAVLKPKVLRDFYTKYDRAKLPNPAIAANVLVSLGVPKDRAEAAYNVIKENGYWVGFIRDTPTGPFLHMDNRAGGLSFISRSPAQDVRVSQPDTPFVPPVAPSVAPGSASVSTMPEGTEPPRVGRVLLAILGLPESVAAHVSDLLALAAYDTATIDTPITLASFVSSARDCTSAIIYLPSRGEPQAREAALLQTGSCVALFGRRLVVLHDYAAAPPTELGISTVELPASEQLDHDAQRRILRALTAFRQPGV